MTITSISHENVIRIVQGNTHIEQVSTHLQNLCSEAVISVKFGSEEQQQISPVASAEMRMGELKTQDLLLSF